MSIDWFSIKNKYCTPMFWIFIKYTFNPKGILDDILTRLKKLFEARNFANLLILASIFFLVFPIKNNGLVIMILLIWAGIIHLRIAYIGGDHRHWHKEKLKNEAHNDSN